MKLEEVCEYRAKSSTDTHNISPFFKAKILLRTNCDIYQLEIYSPIKVGFYFHSNLLIDVI